MEPHRANPGRRIGFSTPVKLAQRILDFLRAYEAKHGRKPNGSLVARSFPKASPATVAACLKRGVTPDAPSKRGRATDTKHRSTPSRLVVPLQGSIAAGFSGLAPGALLPKGSLSLDLAGLGLTLRAGTFAMRVQGDSMVGANIRDGDIVILEPGRPRSGDIVAALHDGCMLLKRLVIIQRVPYLKAENTAQSGMVRAVDTAVHGVFRGLLHFDRVRTTAAPRRQAAIRYGAPAPGPPRPARRVRQTVPRRKSPARRSE